MTNDNNKNSSMPLFMKVILGLITAILILTTSFLITINSRFTYNVFSKDIKQYEYNLTEVEIKENYNILMDYLTDKKVQNLEFKKLPQSKEGIQHFKEVKDIFLNFIVAFKVFVILGALSLVYAFYKKDFSFLSYGQILTLLIPIFVGIPAVINFSWAFTTFHKLLFTNDYWIFDPIKDPIIDYLPENLFLLNALIIIVLILIFIAILQVIKKSLSNKTNKIYKI